MAAKRLANRLANWQSTWPSTYRYVHVCTSMYCLVLSWHVPVWYVPVCTGMYRYTRNIPIPCLYVAPVGNVLGRVPLIPLFLAGNSAPTIPHKFSKHKGSGFPMGSADTADADGRRGSNVYEVNTWLWMFGRGKPRLGGLSESVEETALRKGAARVEQVKLAVETRRRRRAAKAASKCVCG
jgi:hypothetical protein